MNNATAQASKAVSELSTISLRAKETEKQLKEAKAKNTVFLTIVIVAVIVAMLVLFFK